MSLSSLNPVAQYLSIHKQAGNSANLKALIQRINRKLRPEGLRLRSLRGKKWRTTLGDHYLIDSLNAVAQTHVEPYELARELGLADLAGSVG